MVYRDTWRCISGANLESLMKVSLQYIYNFTRSCDKPTILTLHRFLITQQKFQNLI